MTDYTDRGTIDLSETDVRLPDGGRLTEARAEELVEEVLERAGRGRPSLLQSACARRSVSTVVRDALEHYLAP